MKKLSLWLFLAAFALGSLCTARVNDDEESERSERKARREQREKEREARKEQERLEREKRHEEHRMEKEQRKAERKQQEAAHKAEKEQRRAERKALHEQKEHDRQMREDQERRAHEQRKEARRQKREEHKVKTEKPYRSLKRDANSIREERCEKRREKRHAYENKEKEKTTRRRLERESKVRRGDEKTKSRHEACLKNYAEMNSYWRNKRHEKYDKTHAKRADRAQKIAQWKKMRKDMLHEDAAAGAYADLYKSPTWPTSALFFEKPTLLNISLDYRYACDCYGSSGQGSKHNITKLTYGEKPIRVQDILLASKLVSLAVTNPPELYPSDIAAANPETADLYLDYLANEVINLKGRSESWGMSFDFSRYIISKNVAVGCEIPVTYKRNRLRIHSKLSNDAIFPRGNVDNGAFGPADSTRANAFLRRYGADLNHFVDDVLNAKGIYQLGGSTVGLGDVAVFINGQMNSALYDKLIVGLRAQFPTGKKAAMHKLWAPDLGNGGFTEISGYGSVLFSCTKYLNPHFLADVSFGLPAHVNRRVPRRINLPEETAINEAPPRPAGRTANEMAEELAALIAFGDRVERITDGGLPVRNPGETAVAIDDYDSTIRNFGDKVHNVRITKGTEFKLRAGNMFERFILARAFLDLFYDFRGKLKDTATGLTCDKYDVDSLVRETVQLEHRIGFDWSYQADLCSRVHLGMLYTFAGRNVPKTIEITGTFNYSF